MVPYAFSQDRRDVSYYLDRAASRAVLDLTGLNDPVIIESVDLLRRGNQHHVRVRSNDGVEGIDYLRGLIEETGAKAIKYRVGGRMSRIEDALPGRTPKLIELSRKELGEEMDIHADSNSS